jgi:hypothetical protein
VILSSCLSHTIHAKVRQSRTYFPVRARLLKGGEV